MNTVQPITGRKAGELCRLLEERGIGNEEFQRRLIEGVNDLVGWLKGGQQVYPITVDYGLSLEQMIAVGGYDWVNSEITSKHFPVKGEGVVQLDAQLVHFNKSMSSEQVLAEFDKMGLRPATLAELLAFGAKYPDMQRQFPVVAVGSVGCVLGDRRVAYLVRHDRRRDLHLYWFGSDWSDSYRFLAVRK